MVNNTVNGKKIGKAAGEADKLKLTYCNFGNKENEKQMEFDKHDSNPLIETLRENGELIEETNTYVAIKAYPGGKPEKAKTKAESKTKKNSDLTH